MIFPLAAAVPTIVIDGKIVRSYVASRLVRGRVIAPVDPFVTTVATRIAYDGDRLTIYRGDRFAQIRVRSQRDPSELKMTLIALAPIMRALGESVMYDAAHRCLVIESPHAPVLTPTPFNPAVPLSSPVPVFTPMPATTPRPVFTGRPVPRRTPLPVRATPAPLTMR